VSYGSVMAVRAGRHQLGQEHGKIALLTARDGLAAQVGHDLMIEVGTWSAELEVAADRSAFELIVRADLNSLIVRQGTGGVKPLTDRDRREIALTAGKVLHSDRYPEAIFTASKFEPRPGGGAVAGTLALAGASGPLWLEVSETGRDSFHAIGAVRQSDYGIKPYTAFLGALKVSDLVRIAVEVELPGDGWGAGSGCQVGGGEQQ